MSDLFGASPAINTYGWQLPTMPAYLSHEQRILIAMTDMLAEAKRTNELLGELLARSKAKDAVAGKARR